MALNNQFKVKNDFNTLGRILSGGVDLATIFSPSNTSWKLSATNANFDISGTETLTFLGDNGVDVKASTSNESVTISGINATTSVKGVASFNSDNFAVTNGVVTVKDGGIVNAELAGSITDDKLSTISTAGKVSNSATTATSSNTNNAIVARGASGEFSSGNITSNGTVQAVTVNATTGFRLNGGATSGNVLRGDGTNFVSSTLAAADIASGQALTKVDDTNVTLTLGGTPGTALLQSVSLSAGWAGQLAYSRGGTNASTAQGAINNLAGAVTSGQYLRGNGTNVVMSTIQVADVPTLNQNTTGSAATLTTTRTLWGQNFNGGANVTGNLTSVGNITGTGAITIQTGSTNQDISLTTSGTGEVNIAKVDIDSGTIDGTAIGASSASTGSFTQVVVDNITIDGNTISSTDVNGDINLTPNGIGDVSIAADTLKIGDTNPVFLTTNGAATFTINTNNGTNSGTIRINQGVNGDIDLTPNGTGEVNIPKVDIDGGSINGTTIGLTNPMSAIFTGVTVTGSVVIDGNLFVSGSATQFNTQDLVVQDPIIFLAEGNLGDLVDIGFTAAYNHGLTPPRHTGLIRNNVGGEWTLFSGLSSEILSAVQIPLDNPSVVIDTLNANIKGTLTGNVSGVAAKATILQTGRTISTTGDVTYTSGSFDGSANVTGTATIANDAVTTVKILNNNVTYAKLQQASANTILGNPTGSTANIAEISCTTAGRALLSAANAAAQRTTLGVGTTDSVTFGEVVVNNGTQSVLSDVYNTSTATNVATLSTFANASYNSAKFTVQIKNTSTSARCALEIIATKNISTWEGTVYGIVDPANLFTNVDITAGPTAQLVFTLNGVASYTITAYTQAISD